MTALRERLERALSRSTPPSSDYDLNPDVNLPQGRKLRSAAVMVPVVDRASGAAVILTKRSSALRHHPGQIAFPGGKVDPIDDGPVGAALREAEEEIGLVGSAVAVFGVLPAHETITGFSVTPVMAMVSADFRPHRDEGEVAEIFEVPLAHVMNPANYVVQSRRWRGMPRLYFTVPWGPYYIWGATARILRALADRMADDPD